LGEYVYAGGDNRLKADKYPWMQVMHPSITPKFKAESLVSPQNRLFGEGREGKSNTIKLLFSALYSKNTNRCSEGRSKDPGRGPYL
jgi:hypothetical protein